MNFKIIYMDGQDEVIEGKDLHLGEDYLTITNDLGNIIAYRPRLNIKSIDRQTALDRQTTSQ